MMSHAVVSAYATAPGSATGILQSGGAVGGIVGPALVGVLADQWSYGHAWSAAACVAALAAALLFFEPATRGGVW
jgi:MFS family permease